MAHIFVMNLQSLPKMLSDAYAMFDSLNLSVTALVAIALVLTVLFLFAVREAATWFFKIDDLKKDVRKVRQLVIDMESEVRSLQSLLSQNVKLASDALPMATAPAPLTQSHSLSSAISGGLNPVPAAASKKIEPPPRFPVNH